MDFRHNLSVKQQTPPGHRCVQQNRSPHSSSRDRSTLSTNTHHLL
ncbi:hypothetical protein THTE_2775 [Thermogutta terrifontis]|uniref:Uncharacterized protein n=1 Tax=Thermogutta terrifontis TaxID=1331910 RepID=A0A286RHE9_9BACT|nr:hypothetical protein THTE_2775 [Thermogutta terrifontis]